MAETLELVLWVKSDCGSCDRAQELMASLAAAMQFDWSANEGEYGDAVPVVATVDGQILAEAPIVASDLVDAILAASAPNAPD
ncbi:MAG: hypothetical protein OXI41_06460 [Chloroflexota bacterium]|nr:hypothetical protein [Chloroflexota bacterium]MDE2895536.1 hypothetical protein [Chloroflexota bacterium]